MKHLCHSGLNSLLKNLEHLILEVLMIRARPQGIKDRRRRLLSIQFSFLM